MSRSPTFYRCVGEHGNIGDGILGFGGKEVDSPDLRREEGGLARGTKDFGTVPGVLSDESANLLGDSEEVWVCSV